MNSSENSTSDSAVSRGMPDGPVPDDVVPHHSLPPLTWRDLPEPKSWKAMVGPGVMLAGLALGSGEFMIWPHIIYKTQFVFFWACLLGAVTQFFLNMEIERWTLATGETAVTGFCRLSRHWAWIMLLLTIIPFAWPAWAAGAATILSWITVGHPSTVTAGSLAHNAPRWFSIAGLFIVGGVLTSGPVVYNTVERIQKFLVTAIVVLVIAIAVLVVRPDAVAAMLSGSLNIGVVPELAGTGITQMTLLGALAFAGAGGILNLGQSNYIRDKGYGMGAYVGRITSPITGEPEAIPDVGYHFPHTPENMRRWRGWWRAANLEHALTFLLTCLVCLCLLSLIAYSLLYDRHGVLKQAVGDPGSGMQFIWAEATMLASRAVWLKWAFLVMGIAILLTTELGILDAVARVASDIVKVNYLRNHENWSVNRLYFWFLWGEIFLGTIILLSSVGQQPMLLVVISSASNGVVMFLYSLTLLYMNNKVLSRSLSMSPVRFVAMVWSCAFFGYFTIQAIKDILQTMSS